MSALVTRDPSTKRESREWGEMKREPNLIFVSVNSSRERGRDYPGSVVHNTKCWIDPGVVRVIYVRCWNGLAPSIGRSA